MTYEQLLNENRIPLTHEMFKAINEMFLDQKILDDDNGIDGIADLQNHTYGFKFECNGFEYTIQMCTLSNDTWITHQEIGKDMKPKQLLRLTFWNALKDHVNSLPVC